MKVGRIKKIEKKNYGVPEPIRHSQVEEQY